MAGLVELCGRDAEVAAVAGLLEGARRGESAVLVLRGEPGIGKTALLDHAAGAAGDMRTVRGTGVEFEAELPYSGLQLLLRPALGGLSALPGPQREALEAACGLREGGGADPMLVGLAVLSLLTDYAGADGALCLVDDAQWLDRASRDALLFAARRLRAEGVVMIFAVREGEGAFPAAGLPELRLDGLSPEAAAALLDRSPLAPALRYRLLSEAGGNPLALLELPVALAAEGGGAFAPRALPLTDRLRLAFHGQVSRMPEACQSVLLTAAAEESGEVAVILRAAGVLGASVEALAPAEQAGLVLRGEAEGTIRFRHPLVRAAVYQRAPLGQRLAVHRALAEVLDTPEQGDRRAWHLAAAATGPDDEVAGALERAAVRAGERSGHKAAAAAYEQAARLSTGADARARREALAAEAWTSGRGLMPLRIGRLLMVLRLSATWIRSGLLRCWFRPSTRLGIWGSGCWRRRWAGCPRCGWTGRARSRLLVRILPTLIEDVPVGLPCWGRRWMLCGGGVGCLIGC